jgi:GH24 family phage-related lysozyme (muramidase)
MPAPLRDVPAEAIELIKSFEGIEDGDPSTVNLDAYLDPVGIWTIGWGHAIRNPQGAGWLKGAENQATARALYPGGITRAQAQALLEADALDTARDVLSAVQVDLDDGQYGALIAFTFNLGIGNLRSSTLLKKLNAGDYAGAAEQFLVWNKGRVNGVLQPLAGLTRRRTAERAMFVGEGLSAAGATSAPGVAAKAVPLGRRAPVKQAAPVARRAPAKKAAARAAPARPAAAKKAPAKKAAVKQVAAKQAAAKKAPVKLGGKALRSR